jgi:hypothetical protein
MTLALNEQMHLSAWWALLPCKTLDGACERCEQPNFMLDHTFHSPAGPTSASRP